MGEFVPDDEARQAARARLNAACSRSRSQSSRGKEGGWAALI